MRYFTVQKNKQIEIMKQIEYISQTKKVRNTKWMLAMLEDGRYAIYMNCKLQRITKTLIEAETFFEICTYK